MVGAAIGSALAGVAINEHGAGGGFAVAAFGTLLALLSIALGHRVLTAASEPAEVRGAVAVGS